MENYYIDFSSNNYNISIVGNSLHTKYVNLINFTYIGNVLNYIFEFKNLEILFIENLNL